MEKESGRTAQTGPGGIYMEIGAGCPVPGAKTLPDFRIQLEPGEQDRV
ncbi:MAG: hypothetical protein Q8904_04210 [Bacteroidota bacterium]|nr:hypothetical protein [Bacteroidota bacterium]